MVVSDLTPREFGAAAATPPPLRRWRSRRRRAEPQTARLRERFERVDWEVAAR
jgi:hypothetical protein